MTIDGELQQRGQIPPTNPVAQLLGGEALKEETAVNYTLGMVWDATDSLTFTVDLFQIELKDRITQTGTISIGSTPAPPGVGCDGLLIPACLEILGVVGAADLSSVSFFTNDFKTTTRGIDLVATYVQDWGGIGVTNFSLAYNRTETEVDDAGEEVSRNRLVDLENFNPENRIVLTANHTVGDWRFLFRVNYYDDWVEGDRGVYDPIDNPNGDREYVSGGTQYAVDCGLGDNCYDGAWIFDVEAAYTFNDRYTIVAGGQNVFDKGGALDADNTAPPGFSNASGREYTESTHWGINGGFWYLRFRVDLN